MQSLRTMVCKWCIGLRRNKARNTLRRNNRIWAANVNVMIHHRVLSSFLGLSMSITFFAHPPSLPGFLSGSGASYLYMQVVFFWSTVARLSNNAAPAGVSGFHLIMGLSLSRKADRLCMMRTCKRVLFVVAIDDWNLRDSVFSFLCPVRDLAPQS